MRLVTESELRIREFPGIWHCKYWFPSNTHEGEDVSEYYGRITQADNGFTFGSLPNERQSSLHAHITVVSDLVTGHWEEKAPSDTRFMSKHHTGVFQVIIDDDMKHMEGVWIGTGSDHGASRVYEGRWTMDYAGETTKELPVL